MTDEEYFVKNYPDSCYGERPLSPYWDFFQDGVEFGERQSEQKIEELEQENKELKEKYKRLDSLEDFTFETYKGYGEIDVKELVRLFESRGYRLDGAYKENIKLQDQLTKVKEIIKGLLSCCRNYPQENAEKIKQAEQLLKEIEK